MQGGLYFWQYLVIYIFCRWQRQWPMLQIFSCISPWSNKGVNMKSPNDSILLTVNGMRLDLIHCDSHIF